MSGSIGDQFLPANLYYPVSVLVFPPFPFCGCLIARDVDQDTVGSLMILPDPGSDLASGKIKSDNLSIITVYIVQYSRIQDKNEKLDPDS